MNSDARAEDVTISDGHRIRLWEWPPSERADAPGGTDIDAAVVFIHGATYPRRAVFGSDLDGSLRGHRGSLPAV
jgi:hypothetical protein